MGVKLLGRFRALLVQGDSSRSATTSAPSILAPEAPFGEHSCGRDCFQLHDRILQPVREVHRLLQVLHSSSRNPPLD